MNLSTPVSTTILEKYDSVSMIESSHHSVENTGSGDQPHDNQCLDTLTPGYDQLTVEIRDLETTEDNHADQFQRTHQRCS